MRNIENYTERYLNDEHFEEIMVEYRRKLVISRIEEYNPKHVLEIGCGTEPLFTFDTSREYTIVEPSELFCCKAREKAAELKKDVKIIQGFFEQCVDELDSGYDMIICSSLLHEIEDTNPLLASLKQVAGERTIVHLNVPNANSFHRLLAIAAGFIQDSHTLSDRNKNLQQARVYDLDSLKKELALYGVATIKEGSYFVKPFTHRQMEQMLQNGIIDKRVLDGLDKLVQYMPDLGSEIFVDFKFL